ncbi:glutathione S-transferase family protein [Roseococcus sp. YIM B11640]|uniref:glutathione S-transferase family protein n=1 Tax=Roseococcus sp. YIM B11640 TaxID=3133973 RepID=UPI003C7B6F13
MIILYGAGPGFGLPERSPYTMKTAVQLRMAGLEFETRQAMPQQSPKGQLPFIDDEGELVADSTFIRLHLEWKYGFDLDAGLDARQRAEAWAIERMVENHFGWTAAWPRYFMEENFALGPAHFFDHLPEEQRPAMLETLRSRVANNFLAVGITRHEPDEIEWLCTRSMQSLSAMLGDKPYLMGHAPSGVDAIAFAQLAGLLTPYFNSPLRRQAEGFLNLCAYTDRMMARFFPDFVWSRASILEAA